LRPDSQRHPRFREICGPSVDDTYEAWRDQVERKLKALTRQGVEVERVLINPDEFAEWCKEIVRWVRQSFPLPSSELES
jgi:hypothetical protein